MQIKPNENTGKDMDAIVTFRNEKMKLETRTKVSQVTDKLGEATETLEEVIGAERDQLTIQWDLDTANMVETMEEKLHVLRNTKKCLEDFQQFTLF